MQSMRRVGGERVGELCEGIRNLIRERVELVLKIACFKRFVRVLHNFRGCLLLICTYKRYLTCKQCRF